MDYGYQKNEWCVLYVDENGDRQVLYFDLFEQANEFLSRTRKHGVCTIGMTTTAFYKHYIEKN